MTHNNTKTRSILVLMVIALLMTAGWLALGDGDQALADRESNRKASLQLFGKRLAEAKLTLGQAVTEAEKITGGKAIQAQCEPEGEGIEISVLVLVGDELKTAEFDAMTGKSVIDDDDEHGDDDDEHGDDDHNGDDDDHDEDHDKDND